MLFYLVAYDIPDNKRRRRVHDLLLGYGTRVQYSVFECVLKPAKYEELQERLRRLVCLEEDNLRFYPISGHTLHSVEVWGVGLPLTGAARSVVV